MCFGGGGGGIFNNPFNAFERKLFNNDPLNKALFGSKGAEKILGIGGGDGFKGALSAAIASVAQPAAEPSAPAGGTQASSAPDEAKRRKAAQALVGPAAGFAGNTLLTGPGGVAPSLLSLGKNNLLGA